MIFVMRIHIYFFSGSSLKLMSQNISSVPQHLESLFDQCLNQSSVTVVAIGLCETRLNDSISNLYSYSNYFSFFF